MSLADHEVEEPDERVCEVHSALKPCEACFADEVDHWYAERREREEDGLCGSC